MAAKVDAGYPDNADLTIDTASGKIVLTPRKGKDRRKWTNAGPAQVARHMRQKVSVHELSPAGNQHITAEKLNAASADVIDMFIQLDLAHVWGDVGKAGIDGSQYDTWASR
ncbi:Tn3 family transposase [Streptomyces sp. NPDC004629]|uniref:Tn3 family transposase n=1 Tax=Streptomyces sp. NPDC004629 TaxID=3364705 RepID=UPI0036A24585